MPVPILTDLVIIFGLSIAVLFLCHHLMVPVTVGFILTGILDFEISTFRLSQQAPLAGKSRALVELCKKYGVTVLAIRRDSQMLPNPEPDMQLLANELLIVMGTPDNLSNANRLFKNPEVTT
jgi:uncharacterized protein with PhoU and TrkA domain